MLKLGYRSPASVPVEIEGLTPEVAAGMSPAEIERFEVYLGNRKAPLAELFTVRGRGEDEQIEFEGDVSGVHWIGAGMSRGRIHVAGNAGRHLGSEMSGGEIHVDGDAGDWVGGEMQGGLIHVRGRAGHLVGAAYRGSARGMSGGTILIGGEAGNEVGLTMRRGLIAIGGQCGDVAGFNMLAGTVLLFGPSGIRHGAGMHRGTIALLGESEPPTMLPTFRRACRFRPTFLRMILRGLQEQGFAVDRRLLDVPVDLYNGDMLEGGRGEILVAPPA